MVLAIAFRIAGLMAIINLPELYIYIYIERERERENSRELEFLSMDKVLKPNDSKG
jgi:hypothetical protein